MKNARSLPPLLAILAILAAASTSACADTTETPPSGGCTLIGCEDGLTIAFSAKQPGAYTVEIVADGELITCEAALPLPPCGSSPGSICSAPGVSLQESGCALAPSAQSLEGVYLFDRAPKSVEITVQRDGAEVAHEVFAPAYETVAPNGVECGPVCTLATVTLTVP